MLVVVDPPAAGVLEVGAVVEAGVLEGGVSEPAVPDVGGHRSGKDLA